jgi:GMP synthase (glutamine-hydrolysing)
MDRLRELAPRALILSGGPSSVMEPGAPTLDPAVFDMGLPILGICYGMQLLANVLPGGRVASASDREYGRSEFTVAAPSPLFEGLAANRPLTVWMSHGDRVGSPPEGFTVLGRTPAVDVAAMADPARRIYALQFHPEVAHTEDGSLVLHNFLFRIAGLAPGWSMSSFVDTGGVLREYDLGTRHVVCACSAVCGSTVVALMTD